MTPRTRRRQRAGQNVPLKQYEAENLTCSPFDATFWLALACLAAASLFLAFHPVTDPDTWYHLAFGRELFQSGRLPRVDIFTHTAAGRPWISSGWLSAAGLYAAYQASGATGVVAIVTAVVILTYGGIFLMGTHRYRSSPGILLMFLLMAMVVAYPRFSARPDLLAQPLITLLCFFLVRLESGPADRKTLILLPVLVLLWANLHISVFLGLIIILFFAAGNLRHSSFRHNRTGWFALLACFVIWLINPYGTGLFRLLRENIIVPEISKRIFELKPLFAGTGGQWELPLHFTVAVIAFYTASIFLLAKYFRFIPLWRTASVLFLLAAGLLQRRQLGIAAPGVTALLLPELSRFASERPRLRFPALVAAALASVAICGMRVAGILEMPRGLPRGGVDCAWFPCRAADFLKENPPPQNLFNDLYTGGYLMHRLGPETKVFIDGRNELFRHGVWQDYFAPAEGRMSFTALLNKHNIRTCILDIRGAFETPNHTAMQIAQNPHWRIVYFDDQYCVFVSADAQDYAEKHGFRHVNPFHPQRLGEAVANEPTRAEALQELERALASSGGSAHAHALAAQTAFQLGKHEEGESHLRRAQQLNPRIAISAK